MATKQLDTYADLTSPEHEAWKKHHNLLGTLTQADAVFRNCLGLALLVKSHTSDSWVTFPDRQVFVQNANVSWASMTDVPPGYFQPGNDRRREVTWATVRDTTMKFGVPTLARGSEKDSAWDFRSLRRGGHRVDLPILDAEHEPQLFRCFNAMNWAMSSVAFNFNRDWAYAAPAFRTAVDEIFQVKHKTPVLLVAGNGVYDGAAYPDQWMPKPYLGFRSELRGEVFDRATTMKAGQKDKYSYSLCDTFTTAMGDNLSHRAKFPGKVQKVKNATYRGIPVTEITLAGDRGEHEVVRFMASRCQLLKAVGLQFKPGDAIAEDVFDNKLPRHWHDMPVGVKWNDRPACPVDRLLGRQADPVMRLWFERQAVELVDGLVHYPSSIASVAALSTAVDSALFWEISDALEYFRDDCDALVFPPLPIDRWFHMRGWLPGDVEYDVTPTHREFITFEDLRAKLRAHGPRDPVTDANLRKKIDKNVRDRAKRAVEPK